MALIDKIADSRFGLQGQTPKGFDDAARASKLHNEYSINGAPKLGGKPEPSGLDLNGVTPKGPLKDPGTISVNKTFSKGKYEDNLPEGVSI